MSKTFYVTTSIPYANAVPHLGHAMEFILADVLARYHRQQGASVFYGTGSDEHGSKIAETAEKAGKKPEALAAEMSQTFKDLHTLLDSTPDNFIRTTDSSHIKAAQAIWKSLSTSIYKGKYEGWYDVRQEEFVPENQIDPARTDPKHPQAYQRLEEENYFFKLSEYSDQVKAAIESEEFKIVPQTKCNEVLSLVNEGLEDISISRPKDKLDWGVPVPGDSKQVMYVWVEALMNYITQLDYPSGEQFKTFWPANVQIVGKDISRFHGAIWPGMLLALGLPLPKMLYVHGFINIGGEKMSKSIGNVVAPSEIVEKYGVDAARYYFLRHIPSYSDGDFTWERFDTAYHNELANDLGNTVQRIASMINRYQQGVIGEYPTAGHDVAPYHTAIENCQFDRALDWVWDMIKDLNIFIEQSKPWQVAKESDESHLREILAACTGDILQIAELLTPFLPTTSETIKKIFEGGYVRNYSGVLFPRIEPASEQ